MNWWVISTNYWDLWKQPVVMVKTFTTWKAWWSIVTVTSIMSPMASTTRSSNSHQTTKTPAFTSVILFNYPTSEKGGRFCKYQTHLLIWTCFSTSKSHGNNHRPNTLPATFTRSSLKLLPFFTFSTIKGGKLRYRPNISTHTVQTLSKNWHFLAIYSDYLHCS